MFVLRQLTTPGAPRGRHQGRARVVAEVDLYQPLDQGKEPGAFQFTTTVSGVSGWSSALVTARMRWPSGEIRKLGLWSKPPAPTMPAVNSSAGFPSAPSFARLTLNKLVLPVA